MFQVELLLSVWSLGKIWPIYHWEDTLGLGTLFTTFTQQKLFWQFTNFSGIENGYPWSFKLKRIKTSDTTLTMYTLIANIFHILRVHGPPVFIFISFHSFGYSMFFLRVSVFSPCHSLTGSQGHQNSSLLIGYRVLHLAFITKYSFLYSLLSCLQVSTCGMGLRCFPVPPPSWRG